MTRFALAAATLLLAAPAFAAVESSVTLSLGGNADKKVVTYDCEAHAPLVVTYINAAPNFIAVVPITNDENSLTDDMVFVSVLTGSGAKYEAGPFVWWNKGTDATLHDAREGLDAAPLLSCAERIETP
jgi:membrane-bound inhibitor of C-type lysozyme